MQRVAVELHRALARHPGVTLDALVLRSSWRWHHVVVVPFLVWTLFRLRRRIRRGDVDVVLFTSMTAAWLAPLLRRHLDAHNVPAAAIVHGLDVTMPFGPYQRRIIPWIFNALDAVLPVSRATGTECLRRGLPEEKLVVLPNGVDVQRFPRRSPSDAFRHGLPDEALLLCSVGRQVERKGFAWFVEHVLPLLPDDVHYWLAGDGPEADAIADAAARKGISHRVRLLGRVSEDDLGRLYRSADLFVMPNIPVPGDMEGFGVVMLEAGLCGLPVVASRLEGIQDVVTEDANGHLVPSGDAWAFSEAIMAYYHNRSALTEASQRAVHFTAATFNWNAIADRYVDTLRALLPEPDEAPVATRALAA